MSECRLTDTDNSICVGTRSVMVKFSTWRLTTKSTCRPDLFISADSFNPPKGGFFCLDADSQTPTTAYVSALAQSGQVINLRLTKSRPADLIYYLQIHSTSERRVFLSDAAHRHRHSIRHRSAGQVST